MPLNQQVKEISEWNTSLTSCVVQVQKKQELRSVEPLFDNPEYLITLHLSRHMDARLKEFYCSEITLFRDVTPCRFTNVIRRRC
jgi:hypothetical protein